jgi:ribosome maturation factor RimP
MALSETVEQTVAGLGYELVDIERTGGGLLRVTIDLPWSPGVEQFINAEDCEKVTRQLQYLLEVEGRGLPAWKWAPPALTGRSKREKDLRAV